MVLKFRQVRGWVLVVALTALTLAHAGCSRSNSSDKAAVRRQRMENYWTKFKTKEKQRPEKMEEVAALSHRMSQSHLEKLRKTHKMVQDRYAQELRDWSEDAPKRQAQAKKLLKGKPEEIGETYHKMTD